MPDITPPGSQEWNDFIRKAEPLDCEDGVEKIARIDAALNRMARDERLLRAERERLGMFLLHRCWKCRDGAKPCAHGNPRQCEFPMARNH